MMHVLRNPSFFRPTSRPSSPAPGLPQSESARRLSLSNFKRPSPAPFTSPTPSPLFQDGSYLEVLNLKLSEAVSKALAQPSGPATSSEQLLSGKRPIPTGRGTALGALIASELEAAHGNLHLYKAILRSLHRPLSVLLNNLSAHLLPLISSTSFLSSPGAPTLQSPNPNPTQLHALAIADFSGELLEVFDDLDIGHDADQRGDGLKLIREGLLSLVNRVVGPLVTGIRNELVPLLDALEVPSSQIGSRPVASSKPSGYHPSIITLQAIMPIYARALKRYMKTSSCQTTLATLIISVIWRGLVALSHRPFMAPTPPPSPGLYPFTPKKSSGSTPPLTPSRFAIKLPPSRPPSPPSLPVPASVAADAQALYDLLKMLPCPSADKKSTRLAREVVDDAFQGLRALPHLLEAVLSHSSVKLESEQAMDAWARKLHILSAELPLLIALPVVLQGSAQGGPVPSVAQLLGLSEDEYRKECLHGFGRAEESSTPIALQLLDEMHVDNANPIVSQYLELEIADN